MSSHAYGSKSTPAPKPKAPKLQTESHAYNWRKMGNLKRGTK